MRLVWLYLTVLALPLAGADLTQEAEFAACQPKAIAGDAKAQNELGG